MNKRQVISSLNYIAEELMKKNRLILFPVYKPNIKR